MEEEKEKDKLLDPSKKERYKSPLCLCMVMVSAVSKVKV